MPRRHRLIGQSGRVVVLVDDDADYLEATRILLESEGHEVVCANDGTGALEVLGSHPADILLLDYFMPGLTGEEVVTELRKTNQRIQVVLQTGYSSERPPREMLKRLDIQGYHDKSDGPDKLLLWADAALKQAAALQEVHKNRLALSYILEATPELNRMRPLGELLPLVLEHVIGLLGATDAFVLILPEGEIARAAAEPDGFLAVLGDGSDLVIRAGSGRFAGSARPEQVLGPDDLATFGAAIRQGETISTETFTIVPLRVRETTIGIIYLATSADEPQDLELLRILANQAAVAVQNIQLYELAALDPLTGVHARRFFERWMTRQLRAALRTPQPVSLLMVDVDNMKGINDTAGHLGGDQALRRVGEVLRVATRDTDIVGRYGGDEFAILMPNTGSGGAATVGARIVAMLDETQHERADPPVAIRCSLGMSTISAHDPGRDGFGVVGPDYFLSVAEALIGSADAALYRAKKQGGGCVQPGEPVRWPEPTPVVSAR
jgi:diguanylate cyclase (GGDEF)-like protein